MQFADRLSTATPTPADSLPIQQSELTNSDSHSYNRGSTQSLSGPIRYFEITEMFDGRITKIVTSEVCSLLAAFMELIKVIHKIKDICSKLM
jgi:hypothetical protein